LNQLAIEGEAIGELFDNIADDPSIARALCRLSTGRGSIRRIHRQECTAGPTGLDYMSVRRERGALVNCIAKVLCGQ
jgi:hypothetical protein